MYYSKNLSIQEQIMNKKILGIGNAIVDVFAHVDENFLKENNLVKGSMKLINEKEFFELKKKNKN